MATTPDEWLPILAKQLEERQPRVRRARDYTCGRASLPEMGPNLRASWEAFQRKARTDYGGLAKDSLGDRIHPNGVLVGAASSPASVAARLVWRDNRMDLVVADWVDDYLTAGVGYLVVGVDADGRAVITREEPELFYAATDPLRPWKVRAALKLWTDADAGFDFALVWVPGERQWFRRASSVDLAKVAEGLSADAQRGWEPVGEPQVYEGDPPVIVAERKSGEGLIERHHDLIDRMNLDKLNRLVIVAMQAFRQRALKTSTEGASVPESGTDGKPIDYTKVFSPAPGALWELPEGIDVWESQQTDINPLLEGEKADARDFAAVTRTPISVFIPDGQNQSAEGAAQATAGQVTQAENEIMRLAPALEVALVYALRAEGVDLGDETVEVSFQPPAYVSLSEKYAAAAQAKAAGLPGKTIMRSILGFSPEEIAQADADLAEEQLATATLFAPPAPAPVVTGGGA